MIRLTRQVSSDSEAVIRIDGRLTQDAAEELRRLMAVPDVGVTIDLSGLLSCDADGVKLLTLLRGQGCQLVGASLYIRKLLEEA